MAEIQANSQNDISTRGITNTNLAKFRGKQRQVVINVDDGMRPIVMDGSTLGGKFKCASIEELSSGLASKQPTGDYATNTALTQGLATKVDNTTYSSDKSTFLTKTTASNTYLTKTDASNTYLGKTAKAESAKVADSANSIAGANVTGIVANATNAVNATKATQDNNGNNIIDTYATKTEVSSDLANKLGITDKAESAKTADSASSVPWTGVTGKPSFATVATSGNYNDLINKPNISSGLINPQLINTINLGTINQSSTNPRTVSFSVQPYKPIYMICSFNSNRNDANLCGTVISNNILFEQQASNVSSTFSVVSRGTNSLVTDGLVVVSSTVSYGVYYKNVDNGGLPVNVVLYLYQ